MQRPHLSWQPFGFWNTGQSDVSILRLPLALDEVSCQMFILVDFDLQLGIAHSQPAECAVSICRLPFQITVFPGQTALF